MDLACGTGHLAKLFAAKGWRVIGVDLSKEMLAQAQKNSHRSRITYFRGDMRRWSRRGIADVVTCVFEGLNHLLSKSDLMRVFKNVHKTLKPGGFFLFDITHQEFFERFWAGRRELIEGRDYVLTLALTYHPTQKIGKAELNGFIKQGKLYDRFKEGFSERMFTGTDVALLLKQAKFQEITAEKFNPLRIPFDGVVKTFWSTKK